MSTGERQHDKDPEVEAERARPVAAKAGPKQADPLHLAFEDLQRQAGNQAVAGAIAQRRELSNGVAEATAGSGASLPAPLRMALETHTGSDLSAVRVHSGGAASASAANLQAQAYTVGNNIVLGQGNSNLNSRSNQHTIAHEVQHVVQQRHGPVAGTQVEQGLAVSSPSDTFEQAAESSAQAFTAARDNHKGHNH